MNTKALRAREATHHLRVCQFVEEIKSAPAHSQDLPTRIARNMRSSESWTSAARLVGEKVRGETLKSGETNRPIYADNAVGEFEAR